MKVVFYLANANVGNIDYSDIEKGNPGLGGTEYIILVTALLISRAIKQRGLQDKFELTVAAQNADIGLSDIQFTKVSNIHDTLTLGADVVFFKYERGIYKSLSQKMTELREKNSQCRLPKIVIWAHNMIDRKDRNVIAKDSNISYVLCVGKEQMNLYRDHQLFTKSLYIYNGIPVDYLKSQTSDIPSFSSRPHEVTSIGSIDYYKGFHLIAQAWKDVLAAVPDAKLNVIGSGKLYDKNARMGKYGIAEESYENSFMPYLVDEQGQILPSVKFWGLMGVEKNEILKCTRVGVPNPMGKETFCLVALEMQAMGALVTTLNYGGFRNTVYKTGILYEDSKELAKSIISLLKKDDNDINGCYQWMEENFAYKHITEQWLNLFEGLSTNAVETGIKCLPFEASMDGLAKLREWNRKLKTLMPCGYTIPTIEFYRSILRRLGLVKTY